MKKGTHQRALLITSRPGQDHDLDALNEALKRGWRVVHATAMGGAGIGSQDGLPELCFAALVIIEREFESALDLLGEAEEEPEELLEEVAEGDGDGTDVRTVDLQIHPPETTA